MMTLARLKHGIRLRRVCLFLCVWAAGIFCSCVTARDYAQSSSLDDAVRSGELPPVEERLPEDPKVIQPREKIGTYGGMLTTAAVAGAPSDARTLRQTSLFRYSASTTEIIPEVAKSYELSDNYRTLTIHFRKGLKWSDGNDCNAEDFIFYWKHVFLNKDLTPVRPRILAPGGEPAEIEMSDKHTVTLTFPVPNPAITQYFHPMQNKILPKHYLKKYHIAFNSDADELAKKRGFDTWSQLFKNVNDWTSWNVNTDLPVLHPWIPVEVTPTHQLYKRNPYFFKVDSEGNQLPYIEKLLVIRAMRPNVLRSKIAFGQVDLAALPLTLKDYPLLKTKQKKSGIRSWLMPTLKATAFGMAFNQSAPDSVKAEIFREVRFRKAVSLAINREELNKVVFGGRGEPRQMTCLPLVPYFEKQWGEAYVDYNPEKANDLLDEMGLKWDERHKRRLMPNGEPLHVVLEYWAGQGAKTAICELLREDFQKIGIQLILKPQNVGYNRARQTSGKVDVFCWHSASITQYFRRSFLLATRAGVGGVPSVPWFNWLESDGEEGKEPPVDIKKWYEWTKTYRHSGDEKKRREAIKNIYELQAEKLYRIGTVGRVPTPVCASEDLMNVPRE